MAEHKQPDAAAGGEGEPVAEPKKGGRNLMALLLIPMVLLPAVGGGLLAYRQYPMLAAAMATFSGGGAKESEAEHAEEAEAEEGAEGEAPGELLAIENLIVNPANTSGKRFLMVSLGVEAGDPAVLEEVKTKDIIVRDTLLKVLGARSVDELADISWRNSIRDSLLSAVNGVLDHGKLKRMYFTQYVLQ